MRNSDNSNPDNINQQVVELKAAHQNYIGQSVPNPHKEQCTIPYFVDENVSSAEIVFYDDLGKEVNRVDVIARGKGQLTVLSSELQDGVYTYSLIVDGKVVDTKRMIKQH